MNRKQVILLFLTLVILGWLSLLLLKHHDESWNSTENSMGQKILPDFKVNDVADIHIKSGSEDLNLVRTNDMWRVRERGDYPANLTDIKEFLINLSDLKVAQSEPIGPGDLARMDLAEPGSASGAATLLEFKDAQGKVMKSLLIGKKHMRKSQRSSPFGNSQMPDGRYIMLKSDTNDLLTVSDPLNKVEFNPAGWLDKTFFAVDKPQAISFISTNAAESWTLTRQSEAAPWVLANAKPGEVLDTSKVSSLASSMTSPSFVDVSTEPAAKTGLDKPLVVTITTFDNFTYTLKIGKQTPNRNYNMNVVVTANLDTHRLKGKDEKPDVAKKMDTIFNEHLAAQQSKLKKEMAFEKWTYLVNSYLIDPFIRPRAELMEEKSTEKKEDKSAAAHQPSRHTPAPKPDDTDLFPDVNK